MAATDDSAGSEGDVRRTNRETFDLPITKSRHDTQGRHVLRREARIRAARTDPSDADGNALEGAECHRHSKELTAPFTVGSVDLEHRG
jgi:hypothetical protein